MGEKNENELSDRRETGKENKTVTEGGGGKREIAKSTFCSPRLPILSPPKLFCPFSQSSRKGDRASLEDRTTAVASSPKNNSSCVLQGNEIEASESCEAPENPGDTYSDIR